MALLTSHTSPWLLEACMGRGILTIKHWKVFQTKLGVDPPPPSGNARVLKAPVTEGSALEMKLFCRSQFLSDPGIPGPLYGSKSLKQTDLCADLTDVTLADEDTNSILTDDVNMATISNVAMQVAPSGGQNWNQCKWRYLVAKSVTNAGGATWWCKKQQYIQATQVAPQGGQIYNQCTWCHLMAKIGTNTSYIWNQCKTCTLWSHLQIDFCQKNDLSYRVNTLGPLCLWQCFIWNLYVHLVS